MKIEARPGATRAVFCVELMHHQKLIFMTYSTGDRSGPGSEDCKGKDLK